MKEGQRLWTKEELIVAINQYCKMPFGQINHKNKDIIKLANLIGRTPSSVALKLANFASLDPSLKARGVKGVSNVSKLDIQVWNDFFNNWDVLPFESEKMLAKFEHTTVEKLNNIEIDDLPREGKTREAIVMARVNQAFFRSSILSSYNNTCCITGITQPEFLIAGHIKPWGLDEKNRLNPRNGMAFNALHDRAFESGLITIDIDYRIKVSSVLKKQTKNQSIINYFLNYDGKEIILPSRFLPDVEFLKYHNNERFKA